jgi:hypothetical protein
MLRKNKNWCKAKKYKSVADFPLKISGIISDCLVYGHVILVQRNLKTYVSGKAHTERISNRNTHAGVDVVVL